MIQSRPKSYAYLWLIITALLFATALASHTMSSDFLWWDESGTARIAGAGIYGPISFAEIWKNSVADPWHPPAFYLILGVWAQVFGGSQFAMRLFPFLTGMLALAWSYRLGAWVGGRRVGLAALVILSGSAYFLDYVTELRPYMLFALFGVMCPALYWRLQAGRTNAGTRILFAFSVLGLLYSHYFAALIALALGGYHLLFVRKNRAWWRVPVYALAGALLFIPWLAVFLTAIKTSSGEERFSALTTGEALLLLTDGMSNGVVPFLLALGFGVVAAWKQGTGRFMVWVFGIVLALALLINEWLTLMTHLRYIIVLWGLGAVIAAYGAVWLWKQVRYGRQVMITLVVAWWGVGAYQMLTPDFQDRMFRSEFIDFFRPNLPMYDALNTLEPMLQESDVLLYDAPVSDWAVSGAFTYYTGDWTIPRSLLTNLGGENADEFTPRLNDYTANALRVWFAYERQTPDYHRAAFDTLAQAELTYCQTVFEAPDLQIDQYARYGECCLPQVRPTARYTGITLDTLEIVEQDADSATLLTSWAVDGDISAEKYSVGVYALDETGSVVAQVDTGLPGYDYSCQTVTLPLSDVPPGQYAINLTVYDWQTLERLPGTGASTTSEVLPITTIIVD